LPSHEHSKSNNQCEATYELISKKLVQRQIFVDPTTEGVLNMRIMLSLVQVAHASDLSDQKKQEVFQLILVTALKLCGVWQHMDRYNKLEDELIKAAHENPIDESQNQPVRLATAQNLYLDLDGFLVQFKSTLDHMVHILHFTFGLPFEALSTFADYGNKIRTQLARNVSGMNKQPAGELSKFIEQNQQWLKEVIDLRDRMNHYKSGGIGLDNFTVFVRKVEGKDVLYTPRLNDKQTVREVMKIIFDNLVDFVEHFMGFAMLPKLSKFGLNYHKTDNPRAQRWQLVPMAVIEKLQPNAKPM
jgi:hypothetical protein